MHRRTWISRATLIASALATALAAPLAFGQAKEIKIAHIYSKTGPLEAYGKQTATGFMMGKFKVSGDMSVALKLQRVV